MSLFGSFFISLHNRKGQLDGFGILYENRPVSV